MDNRTVARTRIICSKREGGRKRKKFHFRVTTWDLGGANHGWRDTLIGPCPQPASCKLPSGHKPLRQEKSAS